MKPDATDAAAAESAGPAPTRGTPWAKWVLRLAVSAAILFFLGRYLYLSWRNAAEYEWQLRPGLLALSLVVLFVGEAALGICWHLIFAALGAKVSLRESCRALMLGQLAKYVPGKVFTLVARVHLMQQVGVRGGTTMVAQVIEGAALCVSAMVVGAACGIGAPGLFAHRSFNLLFLAIPIGLLVMHPVVLQRPVEFAARKLGRPAVELRATYGNLLAVTGCYTFSWIVFGIGLYCLAGATGASPGDVWVYVGAYALAWVAGFVVFVTPGGLGAREAALAALIGPQIGAAPAIALALLARVWVTVGEIVCAAAVSNFRIRSFLPENREHDDGATDGN